MKTDETSRFLPLVLDLDGTLIATDLLAETAMSYLRTNPLRIFLLIGWMLKGRSYLKLRLAQAAAIEVSLLPIRQDVLEYAQQEAANGRAVYIATASNEDLASAFAKRVDFIRGVFGSSGSRNLKSHEKASRLQEVFPEGFVYAGDSRADLPVWRAASGAIFAGRSTGLLNALKRIREPQAVLYRPRPSLREWIKAVRLHQWAKNTLIFVPLILGGKLGSADAWLSCLFVFLAMGIVASSTYLLNDLLDLESDRAHWSKRNRALASGRISIFTGLILAPVGILLGLALGYWACGTLALLFLTVYLIVTISYSLRLKRVPILDAAILATLFTLRLALGMVSADVIWSPWLLVFSMFIFGSLSLAKRLTEIIGLKGRRGHELGGRGYVVADEPLVMALGVSLSSASIFVIIMYLIEEAFQANFYRAPVFLWTLPVILIIWLGRIWLLCGRGQLHDDPVVFAAKDKASVGLGALILLSIFAAVVL